MEDTLLWVVSLKNGQRISPSVAPTWSWASVVSPGGVHFSDFRANIAIQSLSISPTSVDTYGQLKSAEIILRGPIVPAKLLSPEQWLEMVTEPEVDPEIRKVWLEGIELYSSNSHLFGLKVDSQYVMFHPDYPIDLTTSEYFPDLVVCLICGSERKGSHVDERSIPYSYGLVLRCIGDKRIFYKRIGTFGLDYYHSHEKTRSDGFNGKWLPHYWLLGLSEEAQITIL